MIRLLSIPRIVLLAAFVLNAVSCANFRKLGKDLRLMNDGYRIVGVISNADDFRCPVRASVVEWDKEDGKVFSGDRIDLTTGGAFMMLVKSPLNQHVTAYADENRNGILDDGEPMWIHRNAVGEVAAVEFDPDNRTARVSGKLSRSERQPKDLRAIIARELAGRRVDDVVKHNGIVFAIGEKAELDDPRFASTRGEDGLWTPATFAIQSGFGIYFLEDFDPAKTPVIFIHGAAGSPQDWRKAMEKIDRRRYQPWFYEYPSGMRLDKAANALNEGIKRLHERYDFKRLHVAAHSMGGLVARRFVIRNALEEKNNYINTLITFSSPWDGHEAAAMGVKYAPQVVPSWRDMAHGSDFLTQLFDRRLKGVVAHHLFYSHRASRSRILPPENDGTVSVASQLREEAKEDAVQILGFDEDHVSILSSKAALKAGKKILDQAPR
jgi:pimeloyl-ACP methyl ester carboxylesterase